MNRYCTCTTYTGTERNAAGEAVCERCGKPDKVTVVHRPRQDHTESAVGDSTRPERPGDDG